MANTTISQYILALFANSQHDGQLTLGSGIDRCDYTVNWDAKDAEDLARSCGRLVQLLAQLANAKDTAKLSKEQKEVWDTYLRPFPDHGMDTDALHEIGEKEAIGLDLNKKQRQLSNRYARWYEEQALTRLPWKCCSPATLISCAKRFTRLVQLNAPRAVLINEARNFAEEFVLYHCMKQNP